MITVTTATRKDMSKLSSYFSHYNILELVRRRVTYYNSVIAKDSSKIIGVIQWQVKEDPLSGVAEFEEMHVLETYRGKGIGHKLVERAIKEVTSFFDKQKIIARKIFLFVSEDNITARKLYEKFGFNCIGTVGTLFNDGSELFYCLDITS